MRIASFSALSPNTGMTRTFGSASTGSGIGGAGAGAGAGEARLRVPASPRFSRRRSQRRRLRRSSPSDFTLGISFDRNQKCSYAEQGCSLMSPPPYINGRDEFFHGQAILRHAPPRFPFRKLQTTSRQSVRGVEEDRDLQK